MLGVALAAGMLITVWAGFLASKATVAHAMTHPQHMIGGQISSDFGKSGVVVIWLQHNSGNSITGRAGIGGPAGLSVRPRAECASDSNEVCIRAL